MTEKLDSEMLEELGESEYSELKKAYRGLRDLKNSIVQIHDEYVAQGMPPDFNKVEAIYLMVNDVFSDLERFLLPVCDPESVFRPSKSKES